MVQDDAVSFKQGELARLESLPTPRDVDPALWKVLKAHLADLLAVVLAAGGTLEYNRAADATGSAWPAPLVIDQGIVNYVLFHDINLLVVDGKPVVIAADPAQDVVAIYAKDSDGLAWDPPVTIDSAGNVGESCCAASDGSRIVVAYRDTTNNKIKVAYR